MPRYIAALTGAGGPTGLNVRLSMLKADNQGDAEAFALTCAKRHYPQSLYWKVAVRPIKELDTTIRPFPKHFLMGRMTLKEVLREWWKARQQVPQEEKDGSH